MWSHAKGVQFAQLESAAGYLAAGNTLEDQVGSLCPPDTPIPIFSDDMSSWFFTYFAVVCSWGSLLGCPPLPYAFPMVLTCHCLMAITLISLDPVAFAVEVKFEGRTHPFR